MEGIRPMKTFIIAFLVVLFLGNPCSTEAQSNRLMMEYYRDIQHSVNKKSREYRKAGGKMVPYWLQESVRADVFNFGPWHNINLFMFYVTNKNLLRCREVRERDYPDTRNYRYRCVEAGK